MEELIIKINDLKIFGFHGWYDEEAQLGSEFIFNIKVKIDITRPIHQLSQTVDYAKICDIVSDEMKHRTKLLEELADRIKETLLKEFPMLKELEISIRKSNPALRYSVSSSEIVVHYFTK